MSALVTGLGKYPDARGVAKFQFAEQVVLQDNLSRNGAGEVLGDRSCAATIAESEKV